MVLKNAQGQFFRLDWQKCTGAEEDRRRALPPGQYTLTAYWLVRRDQGIDWFLAGSSRNIRQITVQAGESQPVALEERINLVWKARAGSGTVNVQAGISGEPHCGLSIYRDGKRIPLRFRITDAQGKELASGRLDYG
jgi:hypothetical protein